MDIDDIIARLTQHTFSSAYHVTTFKCYRPLPKAPNLANLQEVTVEIHDAGSQADPRFRYWCVARTADGKGVSGSPESSVVAALAVVHWDKLD
jgi:hypothetical protein